MPPKSSLVLEERGCEDDTIVLGDWGQGAILLHLEDPCFQGFGFLAAEWGWSVGFDSRDIARCHRDGCNLVSVLLHLVAEYLQFSLHCCKYVQGIFGLGHGVWLIHGVGLFVGVL